jgi:CheY-like chemotaxis protein/two-component sensor histidine kinase
MAEARTAPELKLLISMLDHEVRTPLSALLGYAELMRPDMTADELRELITRVKSSAEALEEVIDTMSQWYQCDEDDPKLEQIRFELPELIEDLVASFSPRANGTPVRVDLDPSIPRALLGARGPLRQVLGNLLDNALKFTEGGCVGIRVQRVGGDDDHVRLLYSVRDTGRGIPADMHESVFDPLVRLEEEGSSSTGGKGLGLNICATLVEAMGSRIEIESRPRQGSTFRFELSHGLPKPASFDSPSRSPKASYDRAAAGRVLIIDDDEDNRALLGRLVRQEGFAVDLAGDATAAMSMIERCQYTLVFTDLRMSGVDGFELSRRLRELEARTKRPNARLVAVTASKFLIGETGRAVESCFDCVLLKPLRPRVLGRLLEPHKPAVHRKPVRVAKSRVEPIDTSVFSLVPDYLARRDEDLEILRDFLSGHGSIQSVSRIGHNLKGTGLS